MPKLPRVSGAQAVRALERLGFTVARQRGSHIVMAANRPARFNAMFSFLLKPL